MGATHVVATVTDVVIDEKHRVVTTPAYMYDDAALKDVATGIDKMVKVWKPPGSWGEEWHGLRELDLTTAGMVAEDVDRLEKQLRGEAAKVCAAPPAWV